MVVGLVRRAFAIVTIVQVNGDEIYMSSRLEHGGSHAIRWDGGSEEACKMNEPIQLFQTLKSLTSHSGHAAVGPPTRTSPLG
jgi:hypothetical protein